MYFQARVVIDTSKIFINRHFVRKGVGRKISEGEAKEKRPKNSKKYRKIALLSLLGERGKRKKG